MLSDAGWQDLREAMDYCHDDRELTSSSSLMHMLSWFSPSFCPRPYIVGWKLSMIGKLRDSWEHALLGNMQDWSRIQLLRKDAGDELACSNS